MFKKILLTLALMILIVYAGMNLVVFLRVNHIMSATKNYSLCDIAATIHCRDYVNRTDEEIEKEFSKQKNDLSVIAAIKIYRERDGKIIQKLKEKQNLTDAEKIRLNEELKTEIYHEKVLKIVNENINIDQMDFMKKMVYRRLLSW